MREIPPESSLIEYPCAFPIKVMGVRAEGFVEAIVSVARRFDPGFDAATKPAPVAAAITSASRSPSPRPVARSSTSSTAR